MNKLIQKNSVSRLSKQFNVLKQQVCGFKVISEQRNTTAKHSQKQKAVCLLNGIFGEKNAIFILIFFYRLLIIALLIMLTTQL